MTSTHRCKSMDHGEAWIEQDDDGYNLRINHVATEQDLEENHHLEEEGQTIDYVVLGVLYCPYCGEHLDRARDEIVPTFTFRDLSKW